MHRVCPPGHLVPWQRHGTERREVRIDHHSATAGTQAGDLIVTIIDVRGAATITPPAGWTLAQREHQRQRRPAGDLLPHRIVV